MTLQRPQRRFYWQTMPVNQDGRQSLLEACAGPVKLILVLWSLEYMDPQGISLFNHEKTHFLLLENLIGRAFQDDVDLLRVLNQLKYV